MGNCRFFKVIVRQLSIGGFHQVYDGKIKCLGSAFTRVITKNSVWHCWKTLAWHLTWPYWTFPFTCTACRAHVKQLKSAYFALNILFGIKQLPEVYSYWSKNPLLGVPEVQNIFARNRYAKISRYLHVNDKRKELPRGHANHDKFFKVRPLLDSVVDAIKSEYRPTKNVAVDEAMIPFKGRLSLKQYMPLKPVKRGIKVWECADSSNGFVCDLNVYTGKQRDGNPEQGLGYRVVHNLTRTLVGKNHHVFVDNFFNSVNLAEDLLQDKIYICGTVRSNRQGIPRELGPSTQRVKQLRQGESLFLRKGHLVATVWKDKKAVYFLSTQSNPVGNETVSRRQRDGTVMAECAGCEILQQQHGRRGSEW